MSSQRGIRGTPREDAYLVNVKLVPADAAGPSGLRHIFKGRGGCRAERHEGFHLRGGGGRGTLPRVMCHALHCCYIWPG